MSDPMAGLPTAASMRERMRALLARASDDQVREQHQAFETLAHVHELLRQLPAEIRQMVSEMAGDPRVDRLAEDLAALTGEVRSSTRLVTDRVEAVGKAVEERGGDVSDLWVRISQMQEGLRAQEAALYETRDGLLSLPELRSGLEWLASRLGAIEALPGTLREELQQAVSPLTSRLATVDQRLEDVDNAVGDLEPRLDGLTRTAGAAATSGDVHAVRDAVNALHAPLAEVNTAVQAVAAVNDRLAAVETVLDEVRSSIDGLGGAVQRLDALAARVAGVERTVGGVSGDLVLLRTLRSELADMRAAVDGERGIAPTIGALAESVAGVDERVAGLPRVDAADIAAAFDPILRASAARTENRLTGHVDDAILTLVEALVRLRVVRPRVQVDLTEAAPESPGEPAGTAQQRTSAPYPPEAVTEPSDWRSVTVAPAER